MLSPTEYTVSQEQLERAQTAAPDFQNHTTTKVSLNEPLGDFFYDPWAVKDEYKGTVWEEILSTLPEHGEARLIKLQEGECYTLHADIDDRWHLNILGEHSYLVDLMSKTLYPTLPYTSWMLMNAGIVHSAINFGNKDRYQLVVRKLLTRNVIADPIKIVIKLSLKHRYVFDQIISPWLNYASKEGILADFMFDGKVVSFTMSQQEYPQLENLNNVFLSQAGVSLL
jgi:hypothetical protein